MLLPDSATSPRWETDDRRYFERGIRGGRRRFNIVNAEGDAATQQTQAEQAIAEGASVIVLVSIDTASGATIIDIAKEAGVQVVEYDRFNTGARAAPRTSASTTSQVGATMAEVLEPAIDELGEDPPRVVMLNGGEEDNNSFLFRDGYAETVEARVDAGTGSRRRPARSRLGRERRGSGNHGADPDRRENEVDGVFAANDNLAQQAINALEAAGVGPVPVSGQDATAAGIQNILLGKQTMTVYKPIQAEAGVAAAVALALRAGEDISASRATSSSRSSASTWPTARPTDSPEGEGVVPYFALCPSR